MSQARRVGVAALLSCVFIPAAGATAAPAPRRAAAASPSLVLLTLDTTRADHVGSYGATTARTPALDALAARGTRYARAVTAVPLTLPAHASLLTGLVPPGHGLRDNGLGALPADVPTLAEVLGRRGYATAAFVSSRVLDRRFGLGRGFQTYDDVMPAEQLGAQGYAERDGAAVTDSALRWLKAHSARPFFLWVHYYDPHAPYLAPGSNPNAPDAARYREEIAFMDQQVARLLAALPRLPQTLVAAVGDHGEMLGEHGEKDHGILLYRASLEVPLILAGPGVAKGQVVQSTVATRGLAATLLAKLGAGRGAAPFGDPLPEPAAAAPLAAPAYSETFLPSTAYDWSPLRALTEDRWRFIEAPQPELYDTRADPAEGRNLAAQNMGEVQRLRALLAAVETAAPARQAQALKMDPEVMEALRSLGYLSGSSAPAPVARSGTLDPKEGLSLLAAFERAKDALRAGRTAEAVAVLEDLVQRNPGNVPFLNRLAEAQKAMGRGDAAAATLRRALQLNPALDFLHLRLANLHFESGRLGDARDEYEATLALDPRNAQAWMGLGEVALRQGKPDDELKLLRRAVASGTESGSMLSRMAQIELKRGELALAEKHALEATRILPEFGAAWWVAGEVAEKAARPADAATRYTRAVELGLGSPAALVRLGALLQKMGRGPQARPYLERAARDSGPSGAEARRLLGATP
jgi:choline-sulfatase